MPQRVCAGIPKTLRGAGSDEEAYQANGIADVQALKINGPRIGCVQPEGGILNWLALCLIHFLLRRPPAHTSKMPGLPIDVDLKPIFAQGDDGKAFNTKRNKHKIARPSRVSIGKRQGLARHSIVSLLNHTI